MKILITFFAGLTLLIVGTILSQRAPKEIISLTPPVGYSAAHIIEAPKEDTFVSALEYAQAFSATLQAEPETKIESPKKVKKHLPKRHIAKTKFQKRKLVAKR